MTVAEPDLSRAFFTAADRFPERTFFRCRETELNYAEAGGRIARLAGALQARGVKTGDRVGIFMFKSLEMPVSVYGTMTAGAGFVPLDPLMPLERLLRIVRDCALRVLIVDQHTLPRARQCAEQTDGPLTLIAHDGESTPEVTILTWREIDGLGRETYPANRSDTALAYVMYTSGSTGEPKGLVHTHGSGLAYVNGTVATYGFDQHDRFGNHSPLHFDMSTLEFLTAPCIGAASILVTEDCMKVAASMSSLVERERLTVWYSVPFALIQMLTHGSLSQRALDSLRWVLFGGEPFPVGYLSELMRLLPDCRFSNVYGPAEVNQCTFYHVDGATLQNQEHVPLGAVWPMAKWQIVGADDEPVADGEVGELLIASPTMMQGYWNRPELTDQAIATVADSAERYYRTGDLVHLDAQGVMHFNGRKDRQIKLRGYRIELDEIENAIYDEPAVEEAATFKIADESGEPRILAAVTLRTPLERAEKAIRSVLKRRVPSYAVPSEVLVVDTLPRTGSNKIDRKKLAEIYSERSE